MTKFETEMMESEFSQKRYWLHIVGWSVVLSFALIAGVVTVIATGHYFEEANSRDLILIAVAAPLCAVLGYFLWKWRPDFTMGEPDTERGRRVRWMTAGLVVIGIAIAAPIITAGNGEATATLFSNEPLPFKPAIIAVAIWAITLPVMIVMGHKNSDEHAREAQNFGMMVGFQVFGYSAPIWWMCWRAGIAPQPDVMILFVVTLIIATLTNIWKRSA